MMANKPEENLNIHFEAMKCITGISRDLAQIARSLAVVGNERLSEDLFSMSNDINASLEDARTAFNQEIMGRYHDNEQSSHNMVQAALAGVALASKQGQP